MVCILWRYCVWLPLDVRGNVLVNRLAYNLHPSPFARHTFRAMKTDNGPASVKIPVGLTEVTIASTCIQPLALAAEQHWGKSSAYRLSPERFPDDCPVLDAILCMPTRRQNPPLTNVDHVHHTNNEVVTRTPTFFFLVQSVDEVFPHIRPEVRRV